MVTVGWHRLDLTAAYCRYEQDWGEWLRFKPRSRGATCAPSHLARADVKGPQNSRRRSVMNDLPRKKRGDVAGLIEVDGSAHRATDPPT